MGLGSCEIGALSPKVSIILPVRNGALTIKAALSSLFAQSFTDFEVILVDDGSSDATLAIVRGVDDARLVVFSDGMQKGLAARLNEGVAKARAAYVARMDADDLAFPQRLQKQTAYLDQHPEVDLLATRAVVFGATGVLGLLPFCATHSEITAQPWRGFPLPHPTWMGRRSWFLAHPYRTPEVRRAEDQELLLRSYETSHFACLPDILLGYRQGAFSLRKTLVARIDLLKCQGVFFWRRRQYKFMLFSVLLTAAKLGVDCLAALPFCDRLFFQRMKSDPVPTETTETLDAIRIQTAKYG